MAIAIATAAPIDAPVSDSTGGCGAGTVGGVVTFVEASATGGPLVVVVDVDVVDVVVVVGAGGAVVGGVVVVVVVVVGGTTASPFTCTVTVWVTHLPSVSHAT